MSAAKRHIAGWFCLLALSSVSMTVGNKFLMGGGSAITQQKHLVLLLQNLVAVAILYSLVLLRVVRVAAVAVAEGLAGVPQLHVARVRCGEQRETRQAHRCHLF